MGLGLRLGTEGSFILNDVAPIDDVNMDLLISNSIVTLGIVVISIVIIAIVSAVILHNISKKKEKEQNNNVYNTVNMAGNEGINGNDTDRVEYDANDTTL